MPPVSKIAKLPKKKLAKVDKVLADNTKSLREKQQALSDDGVDVSLSGLHRYSRKMLQLGKEVNEFNNTARMIAEANKAGGEVIMAKTIITFLQTAIFKKILDTENLQELEDKELGRLTGMVTKIANALVDLNKLPANNPLNDETESMLSKLVEEHIKSLKLETPEAKPKVSKNAKPRKDK